MAIKIILIYYEQHPFRHEINLLFINYISDVAECSRALEIRLSVCNILETG
jgi:hypothetical protein